VPTIGRVSNGSHVACVTIQWIAECSTSLGIPDADRHVIGSGHDVVPVWGTADGGDSVVTFRRIFDNKCNV